MSVTALISSAQQYSSTVLESAVSALNSASDAIRSVGYSLVVPASVQMPDPPSTSVPSDLPVLTDVTLDLEQPDFAAPEFQDVLLQDSGEAPLFTKDAPQIEFPSVPSSLPEFVESSPTVQLDSAFPDAPEIIVPEFPTLSEFSAPEKPQYVRPVFEGQRVTAAPEAPAGLDTDLQKNYAASRLENVTLANSYLDSQLLKWNPQYHEQLSAIERQLSTYLQGGSGFSSSVEQAIYERSKSKQNAEAARVRQSVLNDMSARGFTLPSGALLSAEQQARQAGADNNAAASREIVVMQAELEQKNLQFAVTTSVALRSAMLNATLSYLQNITQLNSHALEYAKSIMNATVEVYNAQTKAFAAKLEWYKADAAVYETLVRTVQSSVDMYRSEIQAMQALVDVDKTKVDIYKARIDVLSAATGMYKTRVEASVAKASLEKLKIELFQAKVQSYGAQVAAKQAEWQAYAAAISGQEAKARAFESEVKAYVAKVNGYNAIVSARSEEVKAQALVNDARARQYVAQVQGFAAVTQAKGDVARTKLETQRQTILAFQAKNQADVANYQVRSEYYKATAQIGIENARLASSTFLASAENQRKYGEALASISVSSAEVYGQLAGAAVSGMSTLVAETQAL